MTKHIHIHLPAQTKDASFKESEHHRDKGGKFATTGAAGGNAEHHAARAAHHETQMVKKGDKHKDFNKHKDAAYQHRAAEEVLKFNEKRHAQGFGVRNSAQVHADKAAEHESKLSGGNPNKESALANARAAQKSDADAKAAAYKELEKHPMHTKADFDYLKGKGYDPEEIKAIWDRDHKAGKSPQQGNKHAKPDSPGYQNLLRHAMKK